MYKLVLDFQIDSGGTGKWRFSKTIESDAEILFQKQGFNKPFSKSPFGKRLRK